jgi:sterol desaturase/sphingolipid hydroxylase (fatty acid hydroxylase superfamily)
MTKRIIPFTLGAFAMSYLEYATHRFEGHEMKGKTEFGQDHLRHHAEKDWFISIPKKVEKALPITVGVWAGSGALMGPVRGGAFTAGMMSAYTFFELFHRNLHANAPKTKYGVWARKHHFHHHFNNPKTNHGITLNYWDKVFGTEEESDKVRVPRRHAMDWLIDPTTGEIKPEYQQDYELRGKALKASAEELALADREAAFADRPPA